MWTDIFIHYRSDATSEQIAKVRALYERPGTPGEKSAAAEALRRMGVDPSVSVKRYKVTVHYVVGGHEKRQDVVVEASDEVEAENIAAKMFRQYADVEAGTRGRA